MSKFHAYDDDGNIVCGAKSQLLLSVSKQELLVRLSSECCNRCKKKVEQESKNKL